jgi:hypothetical protein
MNLKHPFSYHLPELTVVITPADKMTPTQVLKSRKRGKHIKKEI